MSAEQVVCLDVENLQSILATNLLSQPDKCALVFANGSYNYRELHEVTCRVAGGLHRMGLRHGDVLAVLSENRVEYAILLHAAAMLGVPVATLNWRQTPDQVGATIELVRPVAIAVSDRHRELLRESLNTLALTDSPIKTVFFDEAEQPTYSFSYQALLMSDPIATDLPAIDPEDIATIMYTSGTTGASKGVAISHRAMIARARVAAVELSVDRHDAFIGWSPMFHVSCTDYLFATAWIGGTFNITEFDPLTIATILSEQRVGWLSLMPGTVEPVVQLVRTHGLTVKGVKCVGAMADLLSPPLIQEITTALQAPYLNSYGSTESGLVPCAPSFIAVGQQPDDLAKTQSRFCEIKIIGSGGAEVADGEVGQLLVQSPTLFSGYWREPAKSDETLRDGWFYTGDLLIRRLDGKLQFVERAQYMIKSGGENIYPTEIERVLLSHPKVQRAAVIKSPDEKWGQVVCAVVAADNSLSKEALQEFVSGQLARYKIPKRFVRLSPQDFPMNATGKVVRRTLEERVNQAVPLLIDGNGFEVTTRQIP